MSEEAPELLFQIIAGRAERTAVIATTNLPLSEWILPGCAGHFGPVAQRQSVPRSTVSLRPTILPSMPGFLSICLGPVFRGLRDNPVFLQQYFMARDFQFAGKMGSSFPYFPHERCLNVSISLQMDWITVNERPRGCMVRAKACGLDGTDLRD